MTISMKRLLSVYKLWARITETNHLNIVPFYGIVQGFGNFPSPVIPYYTNGNVLEYLSKCPKANKHSIVSTFFPQVSVPELE